MSGLERVAERPQVSALFLGPVSGHASGPLGGQWGQSCVCSTEWLEMCTSRHSYHCCFTECAIIPGRLHPELAVRIIWAALLLPPTPPLATHAYGPPHLPTWLLNRLGNGFLVFNVVWCAAPAPALTVSEESCCVGRCSLSSSFSLCFSLQHRENVDIVFLLATFQCTC